MAAWQAETEYSIGDKVDRSEPGLYEFICLNPGTSGTEEPDWNEGTDALTPDNSVTWLSAIYSLDYGQQIVLEYHRRQQAGSMSIRRLGIGR